MYCSTSTIDGTTILEADDGISYGDISNDAGTYSCTAGALDGDRTTIEGISTDEYNVCGLELQTIANDVCSFFEVIETP